MPVDDLDLTVRSYNCLKRGIHTVGELVARTESDITVFVTLGRSPSWVQLKLAELGLTLRRGPELRSHHYDGQLRQDGYSQDGDGWVLTLTSITNSLVRQPLNRRKIMPQPKKGNRLSSASHRKDPG